jgi:murein DD-endopeptidase MepM/ murein hydrolase activator NlpD
MSLRFILPGLFIYILSPFLAFGCVIEAETEFFGELYRGSAFLLKLSADTNLASYELSWQNRTLTVPAQTAGDNRSVALALLPTDYGRSGEFELLIKAEGCGDIRESITVFEKEYEREALRVDPKFVDISRETLEQIRYEQGIMGSVLAAVTPNKKWNIPLARPRNSPLRSPFGVLRVFNEEPRSRHSGLDFAGAVGAEVRAVESGTVTAAGDFYFGGKTIVIDHGFGVSSIYMHLSEIMANAGDEIERGAIIGRVGSTGRVTGPHLHLSISVFGVMADPLPLLERQK